MPQVSGQDEKASGDEGETASERLSPRFPWLGTITRVLYFLFGRNTAVPPGGEPGCVAAE